MRRLSRDFAPHLSDFYHTYTLAAALAVFKNRASAIAAKRAAEVRQQTLFYRYRPVKVRVIVEERA
jgi:hypothetical protein